MKMETKNKTGKIYCLISAVIIIGCYALQKILSLCADASKTLVLLEAIAFTAAVAVVYFLVIKSNEPFYGILISILGFKMLPPSISNLKAFSPAGFLVYYTVTKAALVIFAFVIIKLFRQQKNKREIKALPIIFLIVSVPFTNEIASQISSFVNEYANGNMLYEYFIRFAFYTLTMLITLWYASNSNKINAKLLCDYTLVALAVNLARRISVIVIYTAKNYHISKSYFCWVAIYVFFIASFSLLRRKKLKTA